MQALPSNLIEWKQSFAREKTFPFKAFKQTRSIADNYHLFLLRNEPKQVFPKQHSTLSTRACSAQPPGLRGALGSHHKHCQHRVNTTQGEIGLELASSLSGWSKPSGWASSQSHRSTAESFCHEFRRRFEHQISSGSCYLLHQYGLHLTCHSPRMKLQSILQSSAAWTSQHRAPWSVGTAV